MIRLVLLGLLAACGWAQMRGFPAPPDALARYMRPANLGFESGDAGKLPPEWSLDQVSRLEGYAAAVTREGCHSGRACVVITAGPQVPPGGAGALEQEFSAEPYRGKRMRLRAWVRLEGATRRDRIHLIFTTDGDAAEFVDRRGVRSAGWTLAQLEGKIPQRADYIHIAIAVTGKGKAWIDDVSFEEATASPSKK